MRLDILAKIGCPLALGTVLLSLAACRKENGFDPGLSRKYSVPCLVVGGSARHVFDADNWQELYSPTEKVFCVGNDTMSDYFQLRLSSLPVEEGQVLVGSVEWTSDTDMKGYGNLSWTVEEMTGEGLIWLWNKQRRISVAVRMID